jgi:transcriptional regulator with PAS, ATPase and Fis domain
MSRILFAWIGNTDLRAPDEEDAIGAGPIAQAALAQNFQKIVLLTNYPESKINPYIKWLRARTTATVVVEHKLLSSPTNFEEIYLAARGVIDAILTSEQKGVELVFHISPGTPAMAAVWIILAKTRCPGLLIESSQKFGVKTVSVPLELAADFIPDINRKSDKTLENLSAAEPPTSAEFGHIIFRSKTMHRVISMARQVATRSVPVLLEGESGTGKELFSRAIHSASARSGNPFVAVNCGAIPAELVESELFGNERGAFTGADRARAGFFESAHGGTLFLDEIGELPLKAQVKLLRALQESEIQRIGGKKTIKLNIRLIAATNRNLTDEMTAGKFRPDLFYRLAVAVIKLPPLREREGDVSLLLDRLLVQINDESASELGYTRKMLSAGAKRLLLQHPWPGNVRELLNTLRRAAIWCQSEVIGVDEIREALLPIDFKSINQILNQPLGGDLKLPALIEEVARHYLERALIAANGNKTEAAKLVGLPSYQTLTNWLNRFSVPSGKTRA